MEIAGKVQNKRKNKNQRVEAREQISKELIAHDIDSMISIDEIEKIKQVDRYEKREIEICAQFILSQAEFDFQRQFCITDNNLDHMAKEIPSNLCYPLFVVYKIL